MFDLLPFIALCSKESIELSLKKVTLLTSVASFNSSCRADDIASDTIKLGVIDAAGFGEEGLRDDDRDGGIIVGLVSIRTWTVRFTVGCFVSLLFVGCSLPDYRITKH